MNNLFWLTEAQMARLRPFFPRVSEEQKTVRGTVFLRMGKPRIDDQRVLSGIIVINRNGLR